MKGSVHQGVKNYQKSCKEASRHKANSNRITQSQKPEDKKVVRRKKRRHFDFMIKPDTRGDKQQAGAGESSLSTDRRQEGERQRGLIRRLG